MFLHISNDNIAICKYFVSALTGSEVAMLTIEQLRDCIRKPNPNDSLLVLIVSILNDKDCDEVMELDLILQAIKYAISINKLETAQFIYDTILNHEPSGAAVKNLLFRLEEDTEIQAIFNPSLFKYLEEITYPYNITQSGRLNLEFPEECLDPITCQVMNFPVIIHGVTLDFDTLDDLDISEDGTRENPYNRKPFRLKDITPNKDIYEKIRGIINDKLSQRKATIRTICKAAKDGKVADLEHVFSTISHDITVNDDVSNGYTPLHYACKHAQLETAKWLLIHGADLEAKSVDNVTPLQLLKKANPDLALILQGFLVTNLKEGIEKNIASCHLRYAVLLINGNILSRDIKTAIKHLVKSGVHGNPEGYILAGDIYANGMHGMKQNQDLAMRLYAKAVKHHDSINAKVRIAILSIQRNGTCLLDEVGLSPEMLATIANTFNPEAQLLYAIMFKCGVGVTPSSKKFIKQVKYAMQGGCIMAKYEYAVVLRSGIYLPQDLNRSATMLKEVADNGIALAQNSYGNCCEHGIGVLKDEQEAARYYKLSADAEDIDGLNSYALVCEHGKGLEKNIAEAERCYLLAADRGNALAQFNYALFCDRHAKSLSLVAYYYKLAADVGFPAACNNYGSCLLHGKGVVKDARTAVIYFKSSADANWADGHYNYASCCYQGIGTDLNLIEAAHHFGLAAELGHTEAQYMYALCLEKGIGIDLDLVLAAHFFKMAADNGNVPSQAAYGTKCVQGSGVPKNPLEAIKYIKKAMEAGNLDALNAYAMCLQSGFGVEKNLVEAARIYKMLADAKYPMGMHNYGLCFSESRGVEQDLTTAAFYFKAAADAGVVRAQNSYARCCELGEGIAINLTEAARYYKMAADAGNEYAQKNYAVCCLYGKGIEANPFAAARYAKLSADAGCSGAQALYGLFCEEGIGVGENLTEAIRYFKMASDNGDAIGQRGYERCLELISGQRSTKYKM